MVAPYPAAAGLRRRVARMEAQGQVFPPDESNTVGEGADAAPETRPPVLRRPRQVPGAPSRIWRPRITSLYCFISVLLAILAVVLVAPASHAALRDSVALGNDNKTVLEQEQNGGSKQETLHASVSDSQEESFFLSKLQQLFQFQDDAPQLAESHHHHSSNKQTKSNVPIWRRLIPFKDDSHQKASKPKEDCPYHKFTRVFHVWKSQAPLLRVVRSWIDPSLLTPQASTPTDIIDKVLTSTPRLLAIANLLLSMTYLLHTAVADLFLGSSTNRATDETRWAGRERLGGFLVFKLLLISAVVAPDTLDLLILLSWYTVLSFLRSLAHLCAATTAHTSQSGQAPRRGVLRLLLLVLLCDALQAAGCVALFHGAGWGMVLLLTCDSALLGIDVICHILRHVAQALEERHGRHVSELEDRQLMLHRQARDQTDGEEDHEEEDELEEANAEWEETEHDWGEDENRRQESRSLDRRMEIMETAHARRLRILDTTVFIMQLVTYMITVVHFLHIWSLHGLQFTLIDGVLALHLHSALAAAGKKITERRNLNRIARDLDGLFDDASELDLRKASVTGDVCCICLGTMSTGNVKKVGCGHLYHTHCLREVVERARSLEAAKCPLCRASVLDGRPPSPSASDAAADNNNNNEGGVADADAAAQQQAIAGERALFSFSTEGIFPAWLPIPAFSFEVVRRAPIPYQRRSQHTPPNRPATEATAHQDGDEAAHDNQDNEARPEEGQAIDPPPQPPIPDQPEEQPQGQSLFRRFLVMAGFVPMSPEEEARSLEQLVDMFPQYDRADLLRELRDRGSSEAVVEAVLMGLFTGVPRRGAVAGVVGPNDDEQPETAIAPVAQEGN